MTRPRIGVSLARGERVVIGASLLALTLLSWLYLVVLADAMEAMRGDGRHPFMWLMPMGRWGATEIALCFAMWLVMMIAMMVPSAAPMLFAFHSLSRSRIGIDGKGRRFVAFVLGYFIAWSGFSLLATGAQWFLREAAMVTDLMTSSSPILDAALLVGAGIYQFAPVKRVCLATCRTPMGFLLTEWRDHVRGALMMGLRHGIFCVGCCWSLMTLLFVGGVMNLLWIAVLALVVLGERLLPFGTVPAKLAGLGMLAGAVWIFAAA